MKIAVDGNNFFHTGWIARLVGLPRDHPRAASLRDTDAEAFRVGWDTCEETRSLSPCTQTIDAMKSRGQFVSYWQDDEGNEVS